MIVITLEDIISVTWIILCIIIALVYLISWIIKKIIEKYKNKKRRPTMKSQ